MAVQELRARKHKVMTMPEGLGPHTVEGAEAVDAELNSLDLYSDVFLEAARAGEEAAVTMTKAHPVTAAGLSRWIHTVGSARASLISVSFDGESPKWEIEDPDNRPVLRHSSAPQRTLSFISGDSATGLANKSPNVARKKGPATTRAFAQLTLDLDLPADEQPGVWIFLYYRAQDEIRMEISQPTGFKDGFVENWHRRLILPSLDLSGAEILPHDIDDPNVDFTITPRDV